jgi:hypothetical protein
MNTPVILTMCQYPFVEITATLNMYLYMFTGAIVPHSMYWRRKRYYSCTMLIAGCNSIPRMVDSLYYYVNIFCYAIIGLHLNCWNALDCLTTYFNL